MRQFVLYLGVVLGAVVGLISSLTDGIGVKIVMMSIGTVVGAAIGGALSRVRVKGKPLPAPEEAAPRLGFTPEDRVKRYWLEEGRLTSAPGIPGRDQQNP